MTDAGATVSVIGLESAGDADAGFLKDIAWRGGGRIFFAADATRLPVLFEQETVTVARSAFLEEPTPLIPTPDWFELAARELDWPDEVGGYNLSYLRPDAAAGAVSGDEYAAPLIAFWPRGAGRAAAAAYLRGWSVTRF